MIKISEERKDALKYGCILGTVLFIVNVIYIGVQKDRNFAEEIMPYFAVMLLGYMAAGIVFFILYTTKEPKKDSFWKYCLRGTAGVYTVMNLVPVFLLLGVILADRTPVRMIFLLDAIVVGGFLGFDYVMVWKLSHKLNKKSIKTRVLLIDLDEPPKTVDEFAAQIADYCGKNHRALEFIARGKTMEIMMDGEYYTVEIEQSYSRFGPMYGMKFIQRK